MTDRIDITGDNVTILPTKPRNPHSAGTLKLVHTPYGSCKHPKIDVNMELAEVECNVCKAKLNPMDVLRRLALDELGMWQNYLAMRAEVESLRGKTRTKCENCKKMTRVRSNLGQIAKGEIRNRIEREESE